MPSIKYVNDQDFKQAIESAQNPVLIDFWAEWCGPCKMMNPVLESLAQDLEGTITVAKVNVDENPEIAKRYNIRGIPTLMLFSNGEPIAQRSGAASRKQVQAFVDQAL